MKNLELLLQKAKEVPMYVRSQKKKYWMDQLREVVKILYQKQFSMNAAVKFIKENTEEKIVNLRGVVSALYSEFMGVRRLKVKKNNKEDNKD